MDNLKICGKCSTEKSFDCFSFRNKLKGIYNAWCKFCTKEYDKVRYQQDGQKKFRINNCQKFRIRNSQYVWDYLKEHPCVGCDENNPILLDFDHLHDKIDSISNLVKGAVSLKTLQKEMDKCQILCVKCHRLKTAEQLGWYKNIVK